MKKPKIRKRSEIRLMLRYIEMLHSSPFPSMEQRIALGGSIMSLRFCLGLSSGPPDWRDCLKKLIRAGAGKHVPKGISAESVAMEFSRAFLIDAATAHSKECQQGDACRERHKMVAYLAEAINIDATDMLGLSVEMEKMKQVSK